MRLDELKVDVAKQEDGDWVDNVPELEGVRLKVRGLNNKAYEKLQRQLIAAVPRGQRMRGPGGTMDPEVQDKITSRCLLNTILLDWDGITEQNGVGEVPVPYSKEMAEKLLFERQYRRFRDAVIWAATIVGETDQEIKEDAVKN